MYTRTITLQHLTISLIIISVICLGVMTLVLIQPVRLNTPDLFQVTLLLVVPFSFQSFVWLLTPHTQMIATILALWQLHFIKITSQQTHTTHFPSPSRSCPYLLIPSIHVQCSPSPTWLVVNEASGHIFYTAIIPYRCFWMILHWCFILLL